jgi:hypothetical protein
VKFQKIDAEIPDFDLNLLSTTQKFLFDIAHAITQVWSLLRQFGIERPWTSKPIALGDNLLGIYLSYLRNIELNKKHNNTTP